MGRQAADVLGGGWAQGGDGPPTSKARSGEIPPKFLCSMWGRSDRSTVQSSSKK